jgi:acetyl-CoA acetyltransferase
MSVKDKCAIVGVGYTPQGKLPDWTVRGLFLEAAKNAIEDAGLSATDVDGIIMEPCPSDSQINNTLHYHLQEDLGIETTRFCGNYYIMGATAGCAIQAAAMAIDAGLCNTVLCTYVEKSATASSVPYRSGLAPVPMSAGPTGNPTYGLIGPMPYYAMLARAHMLKYGTTSRQMGEVAVTFRKHACLNPVAQMHTPVTIEDHQNSRMIADPLHLLDCCLVSDAGRAIVVTSAARARSLRQPPVYIMGFGQGFVISDLRARPDLTSTGAVPSGQQAFKMAGVTQEDIDVLWLYDATTYTVISQLEELGFCGPGEGGPFVENGRLSIGGKLPTNTSGGMLSEVYVQGWTGIPEIVRQLRCDCGERQVKGAEIGLVTSEGGIMNAHSTLILRR